MSLNPFRLLQRQAGAELSRRDVLKASLAAAGGLLSLDRRAWAARRKDLPRVVVVGAGFAGLACADELAHAGFPVRVCEARDRVGGRVQTLTDFVPGKTVEAGGELVGPNQPMWMAYAKRFDLRFVEMPWNPADVIVLNGETLPPVEANRAWQAMRDALAVLNRQAEPIDAFRPWLSPQAKSIDARSLDDWLRTAVDDEHCRQLIAIQMTGINGLIPAWQGLLGILAIVKGGGLQRFWDETDTMHCVGGTQQLAERLHDSLTKQLGDDACVLNCPVAAIRQRGEGWLVQMTDGREWEADDVVLTVPPSTWSKIAFEPALPPELNVPMAVSTKYLAVVDKPVWRLCERMPNAMATGPIQLTWETTAGQGDDGEHALVAYAGGPAADEVRGWTEAERERRVKAQLHEFYPGYADSMRRGRLLDWLADSWARGSYSFPAPGQVTTVGPLLDRGLGDHFHFAGEYACYAFTGWMEGALASGVRTAAKLAAR